MQAYVPYEQRTKAELRDVLKARQLKVGGRKPDLVARLVQYDREHPFPFFKLPGEVRNMIYRYLVNMHADSAQMLNPTSGAQTRDFHRQQIQQPSLFKVCRQAREEALPFFYKMSDFTFIPDRLVDPLANRDLWRWLRRVDGAHGQHIRQLTFWALRRNTVSTLSLQIFLNKLKQYSLGNTIITLQARHAEQLKFISRLANLYVDANTQFLLTMRYEENGEWHVHGEMVEDFDRELNGIQWTRAAIDFSLPLDDMEG